MTKDEISSYTMRISQANVSALAVILYELTIRHIEDALNHHEAAGAYTDLVEKELLAAQAALQELMQITKVDSVVGLDVRSLHLYVSRQLMLSVAKKKPTELNECVSVLSKLMEGFQDIAVRDDDPPIMENTQQVYAGLTYGKGYLNESMDPMQDPNRGLKA